MTIHETAYQSLLTRRSIRKFTEEPIDEALIERVITAGLYAASSRGTQLAHIIAVTNEEVKARLRTVNAEIMGKQTDPFFHAPVYLIVLVPADHANGVYDGTLVMGNLMQAAHDLGLGSCWIHRARETFERPEWQDFLHNLGFEGTWTGIGHLALGHPAGPNPDAKPRIEGRVTWVKE